jgi:hypothetical protein
VFDNSKIKRFVPDYCATMPSTGIRKIIAWFDADPGCRLIDEDANTRRDRLIDAWDRGTGEALRIFRESAASIRRNGNDGIRSGVETAAIDALLNRRKHLI